MRYLRSKFVSPKSDRKRSRLSPLLFDLILDGADRQTAEQRIRAAAKDKVEADAVIARFAMLGGCIKRGVDL